MRLPWVSVAGGALVAVVGAAGLVRAAVPQTDGDAATPSAAGPIVVTGAYVRAPVPPTHVAAAYFTVYNTTGVADHLDSVITGAGPSADLHVDQPDGTMAAVANGVTIPAHGSLVLKVGQGHVMIENAYDNLKAGQTVNIDLQFRNAGPIDVVAPVLKIGAPAPTSSAPSGGHS